MWEIDHIRLLISVQFDVLHALGLLNVNVKHAKQSIAGNFKQINDNTKKDTFT